MSPVAHGRADGAAGCLCLFTRAPVAGTVKRRLAAAIGDRQALAAHVRLVEESIERLAGSNAWHTEFWLAGPAREARAAWPRIRDLTLRAQRGNDLGARMLGALAAALSAHERALVVGTDCPDIDAAYVAAAFDALDGAEVVLGPAEDGGYGLIGARRRALEALPPLFTDMPWGTDRVLEETLVRSASAGLTVVTLPVIWDVDTEADWHRYLARSQRRAAD